MENETILGKESMWKLIFKMSLPTLFAQMVNLLYNIVDRIYIGNMSGCGANALAGLGLCSPIIILLSGFSAFSYGGGAPKASISLGENDIKKAQKYLGNSFLLLAFFSLLLFAIVFIFKKPILYLIGASENTYAYASDYLSIYLFGTFFVEISSGLTPFLTAQGKSRSAMIAILLGGLANIALDPLFIFAFGLGIKGAAIASVIAQACSAIFVLIRLSQKSLHLRLSFSIFKVEFSILKEIFTLGIASFVMAITESLIGFVLNGRLYQYGGDLHVANLSILQGVMQLISTPATGFCQGVSPILGYNYGAKNKARLKECFFKSSLVCCLYMALITTMSMIFSSSFASIFTQDEELIQLSQSTMPIFVFGMTIFGIQRSCQTAFVAMGQSSDALFMALLRKVILLVPFALIFPLFFGVNGVYAAEGIADTLSAICCGILFAIRFSKILKGMNPQKQQLN